MKGKVIVAPFLNVSGMALFPFILVCNEASRQDRVLINHERIHLRQQAELLVIPFYLLYLLNYFINLVVYREHDKAYQNIVFEREAYKNESDLAYLSNRQWYGWRRYL